MISGNFLPLFSNAVEVSTVPGKTKEGSQILIRFYWIEMTAEKYMDGTPRILPPGQHIAILGQFILSRDAAKDFSRRWSGMMAKQDEGIDNLGESGIKTEKGT